jgi:hypothetical protein
VVAVSPTGILAAVPAEDGTEEEWAKAYPAPKAAPKAEVPVVADEPAAQTFPHHTGFGNFTLSNGSVVKGKQDALKAQAVLDEAS